MSSIEKILGIEPRDWVVCLPGCKTVCVEHSAADAGFHIINSPDVVILRNGRDARKQALEGIKLWIRHKREELLQSDDDRLTIPCGEDWVFNIDENKLR